MPAHAALEAQVLPDMLRSAMLSVVQVGQGIQGGCSCGQGRQRATLFGKQARGSSVHASWASVWLHAGCVCSTWSVTLYCRQHLGKPASAEPGRRCVFSVLLSLLRLHLLLPLQVSSITIQAEVLQLLRQILVTWLPRSEAIQGVLLQLPHITPEVRVVWLQG